MTPELAILEWRNALRAEAESVDAYVAARAAAERANEARDRAWDQRVAKKTSSQIAETNLRKALISQVIEDGVGLRSQAWSYMVGDGARKVGE